MKYPSEYLHAIADKIDKAEDTVSEKLHGYDLDMWNWPRLRSQVQGLEKERHIILGQYAHLALRYEAETGKKWTPPHSIFSPYYYIVRMMDAAVERERNEEEQEAG